MHHACGGYFSSKYPNTHDQPTAPCHINYTSNAEQLFFVVMSLLVVQHIITIILIKLRSKIVFLSMASSSTIKRTSSSVCSVFLVLAHRKRHLCLLLPRSICIYSYKGLYHYFYVYLALL